MTFKAQQVEAEMRELVPRVLANESAKVIAFKLGCPQRTVENWKARQCIPNAPHWKALCDLFPELRDKDLEWTAAQFGLDPLDETRLFQELQMFMLRRRRNGGAS